MSLYIFKKKQCVEILVIGTLCVRNATEIFEEGTKSRKHCPWCENRSSIYLKKERRLESLAFGAIGMINAIETF